MICRIFLKKGFTGEAVREREKGAGMGIYLAKVIFPMVWEPEFSTAEKCLTAGGRTSKIKYRNMGEAAGALPGGAEGVLCRR